MNDQTESSINNEKVQNLIYTKGSDIRFDLKLNNQMYSQNELGDPRLQVYDYKAYYIANSGHQIVCKDLINSQEIPYNFGIGKINDFCVMTQHRIIIALAQNHTLWQIDLDKDSGKKPTQILDWITKGLAEAENTASELTHDGGNNFALRVEKKEYTGRVLVDTLMGCQSNVKKEISSVSTKVHLVNVAYKNIQKVVGTHEFDNTACTLISEKREFIIVVNGSMLDCYHLETFEHQYQHEFACFQAKDANSVRIDEVNNKLKILTFDRKIMMTIDIETRAFNGIMKHDCVVHRWNYHDGIYFETIEVDKKFTNNIQRGRMNIQFNDGRELRNTGFDEVLENAVYIQ